MIEILPIAERYHRPCNTCVWTNDNYSCTMAAMDYVIYGERTAKELWSYPLTHPIVQKCPCRFHMKYDELKMILDPYFME